MKDGRGALGTTPTMTTITGPTGGRVNADYFARYVDKYNDDNPIGGRGGAVAPERQRGRKWRRRRMRKMMTRG